jgi:hypothetical protein
MRTILATAVVLLVGSVPIYSGHQGKSAKHKDAKQKQAVVHKESTSHVSVAVSVSWGANEVELVRKHYAPRYRNLPPGLQKKYARTGQLPPGWQKKMEPLPSSLEHKCAVLPSGYHRGVFDGHAVIYNTRGVIIDVAVLF